MFSAVELTAFVGNYTPQNTADIIAYAFHSHWLIFHVVELSTTIIDASCPEGRSLITKVPKHTHFDTGANINSGVRHSSKSQCRHMDMYSASVSEELRELVSLQPLLWFFYNRLYLRTSRNFIREALERIFLYNVWIFLYNVASIHGLQLNTMYLLSLRDAGMRHRSWFTLSQAMLPTLSCNWYRPRKQYP